MRNHLREDTLFLINGKVVYPVDGEDYYNQLGLSAGFIHFMDPKTKDCVGYCGINHFDKHSVEVSS